MRSSYRALGGAIVAGVSIIAGGCATMASPATLAGSVAGASLHPRGPFPGLRYHDGGAAGLASAPPPASSAVAGANDLLTAGTAVLAAADTGIWRSADGGIVWRRVVNGVRAWSLAAVPGGGYAALGSLPSPDGVGAPVLATSQYGIIWRMRRVHAGASPWPFGYGYRLVLSGLGPTAAGVAVPDAGELEGGPPAYRTSDGGLRWTPLSLRGGSTGLAMLPDGRTVFATAQGPGSACAGAVYRSGDGGAGWTVLPRSCQPYPLLAVQFISARLGFAAGGQPAKFGGGQLFEATADGGRTWQLRWRTPPQVNGPAVGDEMLRLAMLDARRGWAVTGGCVEGQNGPCPAAVYATADGGFRWYRTSQNAIAIAGLGAGRAVSADDRAQTTSVTRDSGRTWSAQTAPLAITTSAFAGVGGFQLWATNVGDVVSRDGGRRWTAASDLTAARFGYLSWQAAPPARLLGYSDGGDSLTWSSGNGGRTWTTAAVPGASANPLLAVALGSGGTAIAVTGPGAQCLNQAEIAKVEKAKPGWKPPTGASVLYTSGDGGARWKPAGSVLPFGVGIGAAAAVSGSRIAVIDVCGRLHLSADTGARWRAQALGTGTFCTVSELGTEIWLACQANGPGWVLHSADGGATWMAYRLAAAASPTSGIFATGPGAAVMPVGGSIWRTTDGGQSWNQYWPIIY
jgi:Photosynthesis system II assembly factor YCF48